MKIIGYCFFDANTLLLHIFYKAKSMIMNLYSASFGMSRRDNTLLTAGTTCGDRMKSTSQSPAGTILNNIHLKTNRL